MAEKSNQLKDTETTNIFDAVKNSGFGKDFVQECSEKRSCNKSQDEVVQIDADNFEKVSGANKIVSFKEKTPVLESTKNILSSESPFKLKFCESATAATLTEPNSKLAKTACMGKSAISTLPESSHSKLIKSPLREKPETHISPDSHFKLVKTTSKEEPAILATSELPSNLSSHRSHNTLQSGSSQYESQITCRKPNLQKTRPINNRCVTQHLLQQTPNQFHMTHSYSVSDQYERNCNNRKQNWQNARSNNVKRGSRYVGHSNLQTPCLSQHPSQTVIDWYRSNDIGRPQNRQNIRSKNEKWQPTSTSNTSVLQTSHRSHNVEQSASIRYKTRIFFRTPNIDNIPTESNQREPRCVSNPSNRQIPLNSQSTSQDVSSINENQYSAIDTIRQNISSKNIRWKQRSVADSSIHHMSHTSKVASNTSTQCQSQITTTKHSKPNIRSKYILNILATRREPVVDPSILQTSHHPHDASQDVSVHCKNQARCRNVPSKNLSPKNVRNPSTLHTSYNIYPTSQATSSQYKSQFSTEEPKKQTVCSKLYANSESRSSTDPSIQHSQQFHNTSQVASAQYVSQFSTKEPRKQTVRSKNINSKPRSVTDPPTQQTSYQYHYTTKAVSAQFENNISTEKSKLQGIVLNNMKAESLEVPEFSIENFPPISEPVPKALCKRIVTVIKSKKVSRNNLEETNLVAGSSNIQNTHHSIKTVEVEVEDLEKSQNIEICSHISRTLPENVTHQTSKSEETASVENVTLTKSSQIFPFIKEPVSKAVYIRHVTLIEENRMMDYNLEEQVLVTETINSENISYSPKEEKNFSSGNYGLPAFKLPVTVSNDKECFNSTKANTNLRNTDLEQNILYPALSTTHHSANYQKNESTENDALVSLQKCQNLPYLETPESTFNEENEAREENGALHTTTEQHILFPDFSSNYRKNESTDPNGLVSFEKCKDVSFVTHPVSASSVKENVTPREENVSSREENVSSREENASSIEENVSFGDENVTSRKGNFSSKEKNKISECCIEEQISNNSSSHDFPIAGEYGYHNLQCFSYNCKKEESSYCIQNDTPREVSRQSNRNLEDNRLVDSSFNIYGSHETGTAEKTHNYDYLTPQEFQFYQNIPPPLHCTNNITFNEANRLSDQILEEDSLAIRPLDIENIFHIPNTTEIEHPDPHNIQYYSYISYIVPTQDHQTTREANSVINSTLEDPCIQDINFSPNRENMVSIENNGLMELHNFPGVSRPVSGLNYVFNDNFSEADKIVRNQDSSNTCEFRNAENYSSMLQNILHLPSIEQPLYLPYVNSATGIDNYTRSLITSSSSVQENILIHQNYQQQYVPAVAQSLPYGNGTESEVYSGRLEAGYQDNNSIYQNGRQHLLSSTEPVIVSYVNSAPDVEDYIRRLVFESSVVQDNFSTPQN